jgi:hypothetical protein
MVVVAAIRPSSAGQQQEPLPTEALETRFAAIFSVVADQVPIHPPPRIIHDEPSLVEALLTTPPNTNRY